MEAWLENSECERDGLVEHCQMLGIADTERPFITGMSPTLTLKFWQPITVAFILQKENSFTRGCVISDQVGLGKTYEALAAVLIVSFFSFPSSKEQNAG
jgi:SNF2 family DNA or RNA helicase